MKRFWRVFWACPRDLGRKEMKAKRAIGEERGRVAQVLCMCSYGEHGSIAVATAISSSRGAPSHSTCYVSIITSAACLDSLLL